MGRVELGTFQSFNNPDRSVQIESVERIMVGNRAKWVAWIKGQNRYYIPLITLERNYRRIT